MVYWGVYDSGLNGKTREGYGLVRGRPFRAGGGYGTTDMHEAEELCPFPSDVNSKRMKGLHPFIEV